jgi:hypothetical protein
VNSHVTSHFRIFHKAAAIDGYVLGAVQPKSNVRKTVDTSSTTSLDASTWRRCGIVTPASINRGASSKNIGPTGTPWSF